MLTLFLQEHPASCVPACLRMVLAHYGIDEPEAALRQCCQMTELGTNVFDVPACVERFGLQAEIAVDGSWRDLLGWLADGLYPIVALNLFPLEARWANHAVVVQSAGENSVVYFDPQFGRRASERVPFEQAWEMRYHRAILVRRV